MLERQDHEILKFQNDDALLDLKIVSTSDIDTQITQALTNLIDSPVKI